MRAVKPSKKSRDRDRPVATTIARIDIVRPGATIDRVQHHPSSWPGDQGRLVATLIGGIDTARPGATSTSSNIAPVVVSAYLWTFEQVNKKSFRNPVTERKNSKSRSPGPSAPSFHPAGTPPLLPRTCRFPRRRTAPWWYVVSRPGDTDGNTVHRIILVCVA